MAFFNELGLKLSDLGANAVQKTKEMTDIARINAVISEEEKKLNNTYYHIGKLYVSMHASDYESDFASMISAIIASETKIKNCKQQIQDIKGFVQCEKCGAEVPNNTAFCSACGAPIRNVTAASMDTNTIKCSGCGAVISKNMRFCTACGKAVANMSDVQDAAPQQRTVSSDKDAETKKCPNCGAEIAGDIAFCTECGTKL